MMSIQFLIYIAVICGLATQTIHADPDPELISAVDSNVHFGRRLHQVIGDTQSNMVMSPLSAQLALALTRLAARGNTEQQISAALHIQQNEATPNFGQLMQHLQDQNDTTVRIVNRAYSSSQTCTLRPEFLRSAEDSLHADALSVDFSNPNTESAINQWVEEVTQNKIKNLIAPGSIEPDTAAILVNALYFNGKWKTRFSSETTRPFHVSNDQAVDTTFLSTKTLYHEDIRYGELNDMSAKLIDIPYKGGKFRFVIVLPNEGSSLTQLEADMSTKDIASLQKRASVTGNQYLYIPKIDLDVSVQLNEPLGQIGVTDLFTRGLADLGGLCTQGTSLYISKALQKTIFKLTLDGTEAASATYFKAFPMSAIRNPPPPFDANRPFLFYLVHRTTDDHSTVLFSGRYVSP